MENIVELEVKTRIKFKEINEKIDWLIKEQEQSKKEIDRYKASLSQKMRKRIFQTL